MLARERVDGGDARPARITMTDKVEHLGSVPGVLSNPRLDVFRGGVIFIGILHKGTHVHVIHPLFANRYRWKLNQAIIEICGLLKRRKY